VGRISRLRGFGGGNHPRISVPLCEDDMKENCTAVLIVFDQRVDCQGGNHTKKVNGVKGDDVHHAVVVISPARGLDAKALQLEWRWET
jgi:hypothetical protein